MSTPSRPEPRAKRADTPLGATIVMVAIIAFMLALEIFDQLSSVDLDRYGILAQEPEGLLGIFSAPFLHAGYDHLASNAVPLFVLGWLTLLGGLVRFLLASLGIIVVSGLAAWAFTFGSGAQYIVGASGLVFGLLTFLITRGILTRNLKQVAISVVVLLLYGGLLWGVLPTGGGVSWQGHLGGAAGGVLMAWLLFRRRKPTTPQATLSGGQARPSL